MFPWEKHEKNGEIWGILSIPKYAIINIKINKCKDCKSTTNIISLFLSSINQDVHVNKLVHFIRGDWEPPPPQKPKNFKKNQTKWRLFL